MIWDSVDFIARETALQLRRERLIAIATVSTVAVLLLVVGGVILLLLDLRRSTNRIAEELTVKAYFERQYPRRYAREAKAEIAQWPEVRSATFVTREEGWAQEKRTFPRIAALRGIENPLSDAIALKVKKPEMIPTVARKLAEVRGVQDVVPSASEAGQTTSSARKMQRVQDAVYWAVVIVSLLVAAASVFIVHNTVRLALHARWREIYIMQLVGATRTMVAAPFLLEGAIHGTLGAVISCCLLGPIHMYLNSLAARSAPLWLSLLPDRALLPLAFYLVLAGMLLGASGSILSIRRYFRRRPEWQV
jgi:cell division transport system permease protein